jgi:hypothetical protein
MNMSVRGTSDNRHIIYIIVIHACYITIAMIVKYLLCAGLSGFDSDWVETFPLLRHSLVGGSQPSSQ